MNKKTLASMIALAVLLGFTGSAAYAQMPGPLKVKIDFPFYVGSTEFPPGEYICERIDVKDPGPMAIRNATSGQRVEFMTEAVLGPADVPDAHLLFHEVDGKQHLSQVWMAGYSIGRELLGTKIVKAAT